MQVSNYCVIFMLVTQFNIILLQVTQLDIYLSYQQYKPHQPNCLDRLWLTDETTSSGYMCTGQKQRLLFVTSANRLIVRFLTGALQLPGSKGFWLYYEGEYPESKGFWLYYEGEYPGGKGF